jgi:hypothetical protein
LVTWEGFKEKQNSSWVREANFGEKNPALLRGPLKRSLGSESTWMREELSPRIRLSRARRAVRG